MRAQGCTGEAHTHMAEICLSHKLEECDRGMASDVLDQRMNAFTLKGLISAWQSRSHSEAIACKNS